MRAVFAIIGLVVGALIGAYIGIHKGAELLLKYQTFASPDAASNSNQMMMLALMGGVGLVGAIAGWLVGRVLFKH